MKSTLRTGMSKLMDVSHEGLEYIISHRFNVDDENGLARRMGVGLPDTMGTLIKTVRYYQAISGMC